MVDEKDSNLIEFRPGQNVTIHLVKKGKIIPVSVDKHTQKE